MTRLTLALLIILGTVTIADGQENNGVMEFLGFGGPEQQNSFNNRAFGRGAIRMKQSQIYGPVTINNYIWADQRRYRQSFNRRSRSPFLGLFNR